VFFRIFPPLLMRQTAEPPSAKANVARESQYDVEEYLARLVGTMNILSGELTHRLPPWILHLNAPQIA
jgi:hypothetical protein